MVSPLVMATVAVMVLFVVMTRVLLGLGLWLWQGLLLALLSGLTLTTLNTILLSGPLLLNSFIDPDTFGKSCITFKPLNLDQKHVINK